MQLDDEVTRKFCIISYEIPSGIPRNIVGYHGKGKREIRFSQPRILQFLSECIIHALLQQCCNVVEGCTDSEGKRQWQKVSFIDWKMLEGLDVAC